MVEGLHATEYRPPLKAMRAYLDAMDAAPFFAHKAPAPPRRVLAALGPKMLALAAEKADGAHPYNVTPDHTATARAALGPDKLLAVEQKVALTTDASEARAAARQTLGIYLTLPNYVNNFKRLGFDDADFADGGSDRFLDAMVVWGDEGAIHKRVQEHRDAGADHVCMQVAAGRRCRSLIPETGVGRPDGRERASEAGIAAECGPSGRSAADERASGASECGRPPSEERKT